MNPRSASVALLLVLVACGGDDSVGIDDRDPVDEAAPIVTTVAPGVADGVVLPPANGGLDYQLGGAYEPAADVAVLSRDRLAPPDPARYTICYVNGFQSQSVEADLWNGEHPDLVVRDGTGDPITDPDWPGEMILDTSTAEHRAALADIVGGWIEQCAADGFDAVEIDNLDTFTRFPDDLSEDDAVAFARLLTDRAHATGLAIAQKNTAELLERRGETGFDFAVVEECNAYEECDVFTEAYGDQIYVIEYERDAFERGCADFPDVSIVLRDHDVSPPGSDTYVRDAC